MEVLASIDSNKRDFLKSNHTSTHLLHKALKTVLGEEVQQAGSLVSDNHLRFDFTYYKKVSSSELDEIENIVNTIIRKNISLDTKVKSFDDAKSEGALALFGEKYEDKVRIVNVEGFSKELCGGTHVDSTGKIGVLKIISESSLASGIRRIEALTGEKAFFYMRDQITLNNNIQNLLMCNQEDIVDKITNMNVVNKKLKKDITDLHIINTTETILKSINKNLVDIHKFKFLTDIIKSDLPPQIISDIVREKLANKSIALFGIKSNNKNFILCTITKDFGDSISAGDFIKKIVNQLGLKGGGSRFMALVSIDQIKQFNEGLEIGKKIINEGLNNYVQ
jgi:alanyl-tRNA synthetase